MFRSATYKWLFLILGLCFIPSLYSSNNAYIYLYGDVSNDNAYDVQNTLDGGLIIVGSTGNNNPGNSNVYLLKLRSDFSVEWSKSLGYHQIEEAYTVIQCVDSGYVVCGTSNENGNYDMLVIKTDKSGNQLWYKTIGGNDWDMGYSIAEMHDSTLIAVGQTYSYGLGNSDVFVVRLSYLGDTIWTKTFGDLQQDYSKDVIKTSDSLILLCNTTLLNNLDSTDIQLIKLNLNGDTIWTKVHGGSGSEEAMRLSETAVGEILVIGSTTTGTTAPGEKDIYMLKTDVLGNFMFEHSYWHNSGGPNFDDVGMDVIELPDGRIYFAGYQETYAIDNTRDVMTTIMNPTGWWIGQSASFGSYGVDELFAVTTMGDSMLVACGRTNSFGSGNHDVFLIVFDTLNIIPSPPTLYTTIYDSIPLGYHQSPAHFQKNQFSIYPNPSKQEITIQTDELNYGKMFRIYDGSGKMVYSETLGHSDFSVISHGLSVGFYFARIEDDLTTIKLVVQE